jgi:hypothetical protein
MSRSVRVEDEHEIEKEERKNILAFFVARGASFLARDWTVLILGDKLSE